MAKFKVGLVFDQTSEEGKRFELANRKDWEGEAKDDKEAIAFWKSLNGLDGIGVVAGENPKPWPLIVTNLDLFKAELKHEPLPIKEALPPGAIINAGDNMKIFTPKKPESKTK